MSDLPEIRANPAICSGELTAGGSRIGVEQIAEQVWYGGVDEMVRDYSITREQVLVACWWVGATGITSIYKTNGGGYKRNYRPGVWQDRWGEWAKAAHDVMWSAHGDYSAIPDPPGES